MRFQLQVSKQLREVIHRRALSMAPAKAGQAVIALQAGSISDLRRVVLGGVYLKH